MCFPSKLDPSACMLALAGKKAKTKAKVKALWFKVHGVSQLKSISE